MKYEEKKIVGVLASNVDAVVALNVIGHLAISIGKYSGKELMGQERIKDASGEFHLGISRFPFIVTKVKQSKLKQTIALAKQNQNILVADYPKEMLETKTDEELVNAIRLKKEEDIQYYGAVLYGNTKDINEITGKFSLWRLD